MVHDVEINLISQIVTDESDEYGKPIITQTSRTIYATENAVKRNEFYQAQAIGLTPQITFECFAFEYNGEKTVEYGDKKYNVIRTYPLSGERIEIICNDIAEVG